MLLVPHVRAAVPAETWPAERPGDPDLSSAVVVFWLSPPNSFCVSKKTYTILKSPSVDTNPCINQLNG